MGPGRAGPGGAFVFLHKNVRRNGLECRFGAVRGMSLGKVTSLVSNLASVTDLKRIETPHNLCCDFGGYKTFKTSLSGGKVQV